MSLEDLVQHSIINPLNHVPKMPAVQSARISAHRLRRITTNQGSTLTHVSRSELELFHIPTPSGQLFISAAPGAEYPALFYKKDLLRDLQTLKRRGIDVVICLLNWTDLQAYNLTDYVRQLQAFRFCLYHFPIAENDQPDLPQLISFLPIIVNHLVVGDSVLIHCRCGRGSSGVVAACCLTHFVLNAKQAINIVKNSRAGTFTHRAQKAVVKLYNQRFGLATL